MKPEARERAETLVRFLDRIIERERVDAVDSILNQGEYTELDSMLDMRKMLVEGLAGRDYLGPSTRLEASCGCGWRVTTRPGRSEDMARLRLLESEHRKTCSACEPVRHFPSPEEWAAYAEARPTRSQRFAMMREHLALQEREHRESKPMWQVHCRWASGMEGTTGDMFDSEEQAQQHAEWIVGRGDPEYTPRSMSFGTPEPLSEIVDFQFAHPHGRIVEAWVVPSIPPQLRSADG